MRLWEWVKLLLMWKAVKFVAGCGLVLVLILLGIAAEAGQRRARLKREKGSNDDYIG